MLLACFLRVQVEFRSSLVPSIVLQFQVEVKIVLLLQLLTCVKKFSNFDKLKKNVTFPHVYKTET